MITIIIDTYKAANLAALQHNKRLLYVTQKLNNSVWTWIQAE